MMRPSQFGSMSFRVLFLSFMLLSFTFICFSESSSSQTHVSALVADGDGGPIIDQWTEDGEITYWDLDVMDAIGILFFLLILVIPLDLLMVFSGEWMDKRTGTRRRSLGMIGRIFRIRPILLSLIFLYVGYITLQMREVSDSHVHNETMVTMGMGCFVLIVSLIWNIIRGYHLIFQCNNIIIWCSYTLGWALADNYLWGDLVVGSIGFWFVSAVIGVIVHITVRLIVDKVKKRKVQILRLL
ncbi:MAG: hypothetical protein KAH57_07095 [Thermoplasmata archaeon]|nr:hypothetical protein [Thermoplasmata archaeon]